MRLLIVAATGCAPTSHWPPAIESSADVRALPSSQRDVRCINVDDSTIAALAEHLPGLDYLFVNSASEVTDAGVASLATLTHLRQVVIDDCSRLTDESISVLAALPNLRELLLENGPNISGSAFDAFRGNKRLRLLDLEGFSQLTSQAITKLGETLPNCEVRVR